MSPTIQRLHLPVIFFAIVTIVSVPGPRAADNPIAPEMTGHWEGSARIIVSWCSQKQLPVSLDIRPDGGITGKVGDSELTSGKLVRSRGWISRKLNIGSDYIIRGDLEGPIVAAESITRSGISIIIDFSNGNFVGGIHTSGTKFGGKEKMILSATDLTLKRSE